jgi:hypothetical protein
MNDMKSNVKPGEIPKSDVTPPAHPPKVPAAGVGHEEPEHGPHQAGPMGNDPKVSAPKVSAPKVTVPKVTGEKTKTPGEHNKAPRH